jgi:cytochrome c-type biogenesis protein CcsB
MTITNNLILDNIGPKPLLQRLDMGDWIWAIVVLAVNIYANLYYGEHMDVYETVILNGTAITLLFLGWSWHAMRAVILVVGILSLSGLYFYNGNLTNAEQSFFLKYMLSGQSAIMWMSALYVMATCAYIGNLVSGSDFTGKVATGLTWSAVVMGFTGMLVRWRESYLISPDVGHIPVSNLYEVFILFCLITAILYLYYEYRHQTRAMGSFVLVIISAAVAFLLWYTFSRGAHEIQPLVPALKSYWMKIHVPANFIGYGCFSIAAMLGAAFLIRNMADKKYPQATLTRRLPTLELLDDVMYKSIALGFAFFTIATILGALWAAEAWGGYWSWDPKETWALIVWLNYAAWLHLRMTKGWQGTIMAWWSIIGLFVTLFAFLGVNMFLSGLHSYGEL